MAWDDVGVPEWSKGNDLRSFVHCTRGFKPHHRQAFVHVILQFWSRGLQAALFHP